MFSTIRRLGIVAVAMASMAATASAYYYFLTFPSRTGPFLPIPAKFDVSALPNKTVSVFVSDLGPSQLAPGDSFSAILSQIRLAARVWNDVDTSDLRVTFGGLFSPGTPQNTSHVEVLFDDVPGGAYAQCSPGPGLSPVAGPSGSFVPIKVSVCIINKNLAQLPSFSEKFFPIIVHELGHALGLQHTFTSGAMSTEPTRGTTRATPLANDDIAGISMLYPTPKFIAQTGTIAGQVTMNGQGVHMASVVALTPEHTAYSAITNPDGTYRIDGVAPGQYYLYVQALPPSSMPDLGPGEITLPRTADGGLIPASEVFDTQFFPGVRDPQQAATVPVAPGNVSGGVNFNVRHRASLSLFSVTTYSFYGQVAVKPAFLNPSGNHSLMAISTGAGLTANGATAPGLSVSVVGGAAGLQSMRAYDKAPAYLLMDFAPNSPAPGPRHVVFNLNDEIYVLPSAFQVVNQAPPSIAAAAPGYDSSGSRAVFIAGTNLFADTRILFDGFAATRSPDVFPGGLVVYPPPGASNYQATVTALNSDGQSSLFLQAPSPVTYSYDPADAPAIMLSQNSLPAGSEAMLEITGVNTNFADGQTRVGFGSSDILVRRVWVMSPTRLRAEVFVAPNAANVSSQVSVVSGFQVISQPFAFQVAPFNPRLAIVNPTLVNPATGQAGALAGFPALLQVANLPVLAGPVGVLLNDSPVQVLSATPGLITFLVPAGYPSGPAVLKLQSGGLDLSYPVIVSVDAPPPVITAALVGGVPVDMTRPVRAGDFVTLVVSGLGDANESVAPNRVRVTVGNVDHPALFIMPGPGSHQVLFALSPAMGAGQQTTSVTVDSRTSAPFLLPVRTM